jgi:hypoxanthine-DNA glycosylase
MTSSGFAPIERADARVLILGTLPGAASLACGEYYAQRRNAFWKIMGELFGAFPALLYARRVRQLTDYRVALWDVCASASREGSLDVAIRRSTVIPNNLATFLRLHSGIDVVCFNGERAHYLFERHVAGSLDEPSALVRREVLPSTSAMHASMSFDRKLAAWRLVRNSALG